MLKRTDDEALYAQLAAAYKTRILNGSLSAGTRLPSEAELAREHRISRGTVRQAMAILVREGMLERVPGRGTFVREVPVFSGEVDARRAEDRRIGLLLSLRRSELDLDILMGVEDAAKARGYRVSFAYTEESAEEEQRDIQRLRTDRVAGLIIFPLSDVQHDDAIWQLHADGLPFVLIDRYFPDLDADSVTDDNLGGGFRLTEHLIILGHRRIAFCYPSFGSLKTTSVRDRYAGYCRALAEYGIPLDESLVFQCDYTHKVKDYEAFLAREGRPTAVIGSNDYEAAEVIHAAQHLGLTLPDDLAVVGFGNIGFAAYISPRLTTMAQADQDVGRRAADLLISRIEGMGGVARRIELPMQLLVRESCGARQRVKTR
ncbi:MAG TPA: GntR family transcriptional regulator [Phototrophicaceae bacterium]|nr:GntR family transcriptional regulator [Phototrophicaceae bacterium]